MAKGIKVRVSDGNGGFQHIEWKPKPWTIVSLVSSAIVSLGVIFAFAGSARDIWVNSPRNTAWIRVHERETALSQMRLDGVCEMTKRILIKIDPEGADDVIAQIETNEKSLRESLRLNESRENGKRNSH